MNASTVILSVRLVLRRAALHFIAHLPVRSHTQKS